MDEINYVGEHLLPGFLGQTAIVIALLSAFASAIFYYLGRNGNTEYQQIARYALITHTVAIFTIAATLFYLLFSGYVEYDYVWKHTNKAMPFRYLFACFWEGQEGSFILWLFWLAVLSLILLRKKFELKNGVLFVICLVQFALVTMLLGVFIGDLRIGSNPFLLIRELPENVNLPWTLLPDYLNRIPTFEDGRGLNPLLQNYWMTIHPPVLFLGFALSLVPFAFSAATLLKKDAYAWLSDVRPWAYAAVTVLGLGILMGGAWAYEALSFGGFWAWDPVENASLVPWLILVAAAHMIVIARRTKKHVFSAHLLSALGFFFIVYSTFLTRSGILGDTSVHSFTDNGMIGQLLFYLLLSLFCAADLLTYKVEKRLRIVHRALSVLMLLLIAFQQIVLEALVLFVLFQIMAFIRSAKNKNVEKDDDFSSREFWMFIGGFVLVLSALQISFSTSIPVINKFLEPFSGMFTDLYNWTDYNIFKDLAAANFAPPSQAIEHYNKWQAPFAVLILICIGLAQFLKFRKTKWKEWLLKNISTFIVTLVIFVTLFVFLEYDSLNPLWLVLLFFGLFALTVNAKHLIQYRKTFASNGASSLSHIGFALIILGTLISGGKKDKISENSSGIDVRKVDDSFNNNEDLLLFLGDTIYMGDYFVRYNRKFSEGINLFYEIDFYEAESNFYNENDTVTAGGEVYRCVQGHSSSSNFFNDVYNWIPLDGYQLKDYPAWESSAVGDKLYSLYPSVQKNAAFGNVPEPDTKHYLDKDVFTHVKWAELEDPETDEQGYMEVDFKDVHLGDTIFTSKHLLIFNGTEKIDNPETIGLEPKDIVIQASFDVFNEQGFVEKLNPQYIVRDTSFTIPTGVQSDLAGIRMAIESLHGDDNGIQIAIQENIANRREFIVFQAIVFPGINVLWLGCIIMTLGGILSVFRRSRKGNVSRSNSK